MPVITGYQATRYIRDAETKRGTKIIAVTARVLGEAEEQAIAAVLGDDAAIFQIADQLSAQHQPLCQLLRHYATKYDFLPIIDAAKASLQT